MSDGKKFYCFCSSNCKYETMTKEQIIAAIAEATGATPSNIDDAFITKVMEKNGQQPLQFWIGTQAEYNALTPEENVFYIFTDGNEIADFERLARETAEQVVREVQADVAGLKMIDISNTVALSYDVAEGGGNLSSRSIQGLTYKYSPALNMVFYAFQLVFKGKLAKGERLHFYHISDDEKYMPKELEGVAYPVTARRRAFSGEYWADGVWLYAEEAQDTGGLDSSMDFCGWYFCDPQ